MPGLIDRIKKILFSPKTEWPVIEPEPTSIAELYKGYVIPLAAFSALMSFLRMSVIGISFGFGSFRVPLATGLVWTVVNFIMGLIGLFLFGLHHRFPGAHVLRSTGPAPGAEDRGLHVHARGFGLGPRTVAGAGQAPAVHRSALRHLSAVSRVAAPDAQPEREGGGLHGRGDHLRHPGEHRPRRRDVDVGRVTGFSPYGFGGNFGGTADSGLGMTQEERQARAAAAVGQIIGGALGTDQNGKADIGAAIGKLAAAGRKMEQAAAGAGRQHRSAGNARIPRRRPQARKTRRRRPPVCSRRWAARWAAIGTSTRSTSTP